MAGHLMAATIGSPGKVSNGPTSFWAEPELDSFCKWVKMSFLGGNMSKNGVERVLNRLKMAGHLMVATIGSPGTVSSGPTSFWAEPELDSFSWWMIPLLNR